MQHSSKNVPLKERVDRAQKSQSEFLKKHGAIVVLRDEGSPLSHFLAKRLGQGHATAKWENIHPGCMRLTVTYRGQVWSLRVPKPRPPEEEE